MIFCICVYCGLYKKIDSIRTKMTEEIDFEVSPTAVPAIALLQQHDASGGIRNWGRNRAVKTNRLVGPIANLQGHYFQPSLYVCLSVCLLPFNIARF